MPEPEGLTAALIRLQSQLPRITKDATGQIQSRTYTYANLASIHAAVFPLLHELGLLWVCMPTLREDGSFVLGYRLGHVASEDQLEGEYPLPAPGTAPQALGSAITYARRYALITVLGIAPVEDDDDDGKAAQDAAEDDPPAWQRWKPPANPRTRKAQRSRGPQDDEWNTADADEPGSITDRQRSRLMAAFNKAGILERKDRLAFAMSKLDLPELASSNDLSMRQAGELIAMLEAEEQT